MQGMHREKAGEWEEREKVNGQCNLSIIKGKHSQKMRAENLESRNMQLMSHHKHISKINQQRVVCLNKGFFYLIKKGGFKNKKFRERNIGKFYTRKRTLKLFRRSNVRLTSQSKRKRTDSKIK